MHDPSRAMRYPGKIGHEHPNTSSDAFSDICDRGAMAFHPPWEPLRRPAKEAWWTNNTTMSSPTTPLHNGTFLEGAQGHPSTNAKRTRTVAIIKTHALDHRFDIEPRISEAGFEVRPKLLLIMFYE